jgi:hypothetical protein
MIRRADTDSYNFSHFNVAEVSCPAGIKNRCFDNCLIYAKHYRKLGRDVSIVLGIGGKGLGRDVGFTYHYLLQDNETGEYIDPQLNTSVILPIHKWSVEEYSSERKKFKRLKNSKEYPTGHIFLYYLAEEYDYIYAGSLLIRSLVDAKLSKRKIKDYLKYMKSYIHYGYSPKFGECLIPTLEFW